MQTFYLDDKDKIKLSKLLLEMCICFSKEEAEMLVSMGDVFVNGIYESDPDAQIFSGDVVKVDGEKIQVE